jgi:hypothetical protein
LVFRKYMEKFAEYKNPRLAIVFRRNDKKVESY